MLFHLIRVQRVIFRKEQLKTPNNFCAQLCACGDDVNGVGFTTTLSIISFQPSWVLLSYWVRRSSSGTWSNRSCDRRTSLRIFLYQRTNYRLNLHELLLQQLESGIGGGSAMGGRAARQRTLSSRRRSTRRKTKFNLVTSWSTHPLLSSAGKEKAGMVYSVSGRTRGV